jgi:hypothetical protein
MAWDKTLPEDDGLLINAPGQIRANWIALELGTDSALLITNAKIAPNAAIADSKLAAITTASKVNGSAITDLSNLPESAGDIPIPNLDGTACTLTGNQTISGVKTFSTPIATGSGGTGSNVAANGAGGVVVPAGAVNAANGAVVLDASSRLPAVSGELLTGIPIMTQVNDTDAGTVFSSEETTFLTVDKTITSGKTILLIATGYLKGQTGVYSADQDITIKLKQGSTVVQTIIFKAPEASYSAWSVSGIVTGLSGVVTFSVTAADGGKNTTAYGNLTVLEF